MPDSDINLSSLFSAHMSFKFPELSISPEVRLWLGAIYDRVRSGRRINASELIVELWGKIPEDFRYREIDRRLAPFGVNITLLGVLHVDPSSDYPAKADKVIKFIREVIVKEPHITEVTAQQVADDTGVALGDVKFVFNLIHHLGDFWNGASGDETGYNSITIDYENVKREYLRYRDIETLLNRFSENNTPTTATHQPQHQSHSGGEANITRFVFNPQDEFSFPILSSQNHQSMIDVFISHSSQDEKVAETLADLLKVALKTEKIRCTSVPGYKLEPGASVEDTLRREIHQSRVFIGLITLSSLASHYVLFELGARWGAKMDMIPVLASGAGYEDLRDPLKSRNPIRCDVRAEVVDLLDKVASELGLILGKASGYQKLIDELVKRSKPKRTKQSGRRTSVKSTAKTEEVAEPQLARGKDTLSSSPSAIQEADVLITGEVASWLLKDFFNGLIAWLDLVRQRFSHNKFELSVAPVQLNSEVLVYRIEPFSRETWESLKNSNAGEYFLNVFPSTSARLISFEKKMDEFGRVLSDLESAVEASPALLRRLIDLYAKKMERERIPRWEFERLPLEEITSRWMGELRLGISNFKVESKDFLVRFTAYKLLGLESEFPVQARRDDEVILNFTGDLPEVLKDDAAVTTSMGKAKLLCADIARESDALFGRLKHERLSMSLRYKVPF